VLVALIAAGCSGDARSELAKATDHARRLYDRACSILKDPVYKVGDQYVPLSEVADDADAGEIKTVPHGQINPEVDKVLDRAAEELSGALASAGEASPAELVAARAVLARTYALQGFRHAIHAAQQRQQAWKLLRRLEYAAITMGDHGKRIANCDALLSVTDASLGKMSSRAKADAQAAQTQIADAKKKVADLQAERARLEAANEKLLADARKLRIDSQLADVIKGIGLFDQAKAKEDQATDNSVRVTEIEDATQFLNSQITTIEVDLAAAGKRTAATTQIAAARQQRQADIQAKKQEFVKLLTDTQKEVETLAGQVTVVCKATGATERKARDAYGRCEAEYGAHEKLAQPADAVLIALFADARMAQADLCVRTLSLQARIDKVVAEVTRLWSSLPVQKTPPAVIAQVAGYLADADKTRREAQDKFRWAAKDYERAVEGVGKKLRWAYRVQVAAAYTGLYRLSGDPAVRRKATAVLDELGSEEASRYVGPHAAHFRKLLAQTPTTAPASP